MSIEDGRVPVTVTLEYGAPGGAVDAHIPILAGEIRILGLFGNAAAGTSAVSLGIEAGADDLTPPNPVGVE